MKRHSSFSSSREIEKADSLVNIKRHGSSKSPDKTVCDAGNIGGNWTVSQLFRLCLEHTYMIYKCDHSECVFGVSLSLDVNQYVSGKYGKTRAEEDARRYLKEKEQMEKEREVIKNALLILRNDRKEVKEQLKDVTGKTHSISD